MVGDARAAAEQQLVAFEGRGAVEVGVAGFSHQLKKKVKEYQAWRDSVGKDKVITPDMLVKDIMDRLP